MFEKAGNTTGGIEIIFIILLGGLFLCQTLGKLVMWLLARFKNTSANGREVIEHLAKRNHLEDSKIKVNKFDVRSSFYSYKKKSDEFIISSSIAKQENLASNFYGIQAIASANERNNRTLQSRWQLIGVGLLSIVPYLFFMGTMLLIYLPNGSIDHVSKYSIPTEALCIIGWIFILICLFWWMSITQEIELNVEELAKQMDSNLLSNNLKWWMKYCSYIPFSFRTII